jgi:hypothetical protein
MREAGRLRQEAQLRALVLDAVVDRPDQTSWASVIEAAASERTDSQQDFEGALHSS